MNKVIITVSGGVADVYLKPEGVEVHILDFDNLEEEGKAEQVEKALAAGNFENAVSIAAEE